MQECGQPLEFLFFVQHSGHLRTRSGRTEGAPGYARRYPDRALPRALRAQPFHQVWLIVPKTVQCDCYYAIRIVPVLICIATAHVLLSHCRARIWCSHAMGSAFSKVPRTGHPESTSSTLLNLLTSLGAGFLFPKFLNPPAAMFSLLLVFSQSWKMPGRRFIGVWRPGASDVLGCNRTWLVHNIAATNTEAPGLHTDVSDALD